MSTDAEKIYFKKIKRFKRLSQEDEYELAMRAKAGDSEAVESLVKANLLFVVWIAKKYRRNEVDFCEIINAGNIGLLNAARSYDPERGCKFISYAVQGIRRSIIVFLTNATVIYEVPEAFRRLAWSVKKLQDNYYAHNGHYPDEDVLMKEFCLSEKEFMIINELFFAKNISLDEPLVTKENVLRNEIISKPDQESTDCLAVVKSELDAFERALSSLSYKSRRVIECSYGLKGELKRSTATIARNLGISMGKVIKLRKSAIEQMRKKLQVDGLNGY
jgi:RNA polymerase primary sigma factor